MKDEFYGIIQAGILGFSIGGLLSVEYPDNLILLIPFLVSLFFLSVEIKGLLKC